jgi:hypothetical protein
LLFFRNGSLDESAGARFGGRRVVRDVDAHGAHLALLADRDCVDLRTDDGVSAALGPTCGSGVGRLEHVGLVGKVGMRDQLAAIKIWVLAGGVGWR